MSTASAPCRLDQIDPHSGAATSRAASCLSRRLEDSGPPPHSVCEARLSEEEYRWLLSWARVVPLRAFEEAWAPWAEAGLVLIALLSEWNRRESDGDSVFLGAGALFSAETRHRLFDGSGNPRSNPVRVAITEAAVRHRLRHAFAPGDQAALPWYLTVQLQYGFCHAQIPRLFDWLRGLPPTEAMQRLLAGTGPQRSRSFQRLVSDLRLYRRDYSSGAEIRPRLESNHWVLPGWVPELLAARHAGEGEAAGECDEHLLARRVVLGWDAARGPVVRLLPAAPVVDQEQVADRYDLRAGGRLLASWLLQPRTAAADVGEYRTAAADIVLPPVDPELILRLEDEWGETVATQVLPLWDPSAEVQVLRLGSPPASDSERWEAGKDLVLVTRPGHVAAPPPDEWFLTGYGTSNERRWLRYASSPRLVAVADGSGLPVWEAHAPPAPAWADGVRVSAVTDSPPLSLGDRLWFRVSTPAGVRTSRVVANGAGLALDQSSPRAGPVTLLPEQAAGGFRLRVEVTRGDARAVHNATVRPACTGLAHRPATEDAGWNRWCPSDWLLGYQTRQDTFRVFSDPDTPGVLLEGAEVHGRADGRPRRLHHLLGTGAPLDLAPGPYNTGPGDRQRLAAGVHDTGVIAAGTEPHAWPGPLRLSLLRPVAPREGHFVLLWSNRHGLHRVGPEHVSFDPAARTWAVPTPWPERPESLLAAVGFDHQRLGCWWWGQFDRLLSPDAAENPGLSVRQRIALTRWLRLPALRANRWGRPALEVAAHAHPADLLAVGLFDCGLSGLKLQFERTTADRLAFDAIARQMMLDPPIGAAAAEAVADLFEVGDDPRALMVGRLFPTHPILAARIAFAQWPDARATRYKFRQNVREHRMRLAGLPHNAQEVHCQLRLGDLLRGACATFAENNREPTNDGFVEHALVRPAIRFAFDGVAFTEMNRTNLLVALGAGDFRLYLALRLLKAMEDRL